MRPSRAPVAHEPVRRADVGPRLDRARPCRRPSRSDPSSRPTARRTPIAWWRVAAAAGPRAGGRGAWWWGSRDGPTPDDDRAAGRSSATRGAGARPSRCPATRRTRSCRCWTRRRSRCEQWVRRRGRLRPASALARARRARARRSTSRWSPTASRRCEGPTSLDGATRSRRPRRARRLSTCSYRLSGALERHATADRAPGAGDLARPVGYDAEPGLDDHRVPRRHRAVAGVHAAASATRCPVPCGVEAGRTGGGSCRRPAWATYQVMAQLDLHAVGLSDRGRSAAPGRGPGRGSGRSRAG